MGWGWVQRWPLTPIDAGTYSCPTGEASKPENLDGFVDHLFEPALAPGFSVSGLHTFPFALGLGPGLGLGDCPILFLQGSSSDGARCPFRIWNKAGP